MKKRILIIVITIFLFNFPTIAIAADNENCATVTTTIEKYNESIEKLRKLKCDSITNTEKYNECSQTEMYRSIYLSKIFKYNQEKNECSSELSSIVENNKDSCSGILDDSFKSLVSSIMNIFYLVAPFLIIIFGSLDFMKVLTSSNEKDSKKAKATFVKRMIAFVLLYLIPVFINIIISLNGSEYDLSGNAYVCKTENYKIGKGSFITFINNATLKMDTVFFPSSNETASSNGTNISGNSTADNNYTSSTSSDLTRVSNNGAFKIRGDNDRVTQSSAPEYYVNGKNVTFQCVWYARARAQEIIGTSTTLSESEKRERIEMLNKAGADGWGWYKLSQGNGPLSRFQSSNNYKDVRAGSIVAWSGGNVPCSSGPGGKCGHVGIIEDYDPKTNIVRVSEAGKNGGTWSTYFWASREGTLESAVQNKNGGKYKFLGYVFLLEPLK